MKRYTLGFVIVLIATVSFFMHRASIKGAEAAATKSSLSPLVLDVDNQSDKDITLEPTYKKTIVKPGDTTRQIIGTTQKVAKGAHVTITFDPNTDPKLTPDLLPGIDWLAITPVTKTVVPVHTIGDNPGIQKIKVPKN